MKNGCIMLFCAVAVLAVACQKKAVRDIEVTYPETKKVDQIDDYFGTLVADPYRWLEDDNAEDVKQWVEAQNAVTFGYLEQIPFREKIRSRLTEIYNYPRYSSPFRVGEYYLFTKNDGLQNQSVYYIQKGLDGTPAVGRLASTTARRPVRRR
jgi:prolyl oligopeptidase